MECANVATQIETWLINRLKESKQKGFVVGVSGGIDSALVSALCARTGLPTILVSMPIHQGKSEHSRASEHMDWLAGQYNNVVLREANLTSFSDSYLDYMASVDLTIFGGTNAFLVEANVRSRLRMVTLYAFANAYQFLVVGTGNKVEDFGIGFFTKGGDGQVDISPIGDLLKSEVRALAAHLGVKEELVKAAPTDGLWNDGRTDEDQIGATYDELEWVMGWLNGKAPSSVVTTYGADGNVANVNTAFCSSRQLDVLRIYLERHIANGHKMRMPPICIIER